MIQKIFLVYLLAVTIFLTACVQTRLSTPQVISTSTSTLTPTKVSPTAIPTSSPTLTPIPEPTLPSPPTATRRIDIRNETAVEYLTSILTGKPGQVVTHTLVITNLSSSYRQYDYLWARIKPTREMFLDKLRGWNYDVRRDEYSNSDYEFFGLDSQEHKKISIPVVIPDYATNGMVSELTVKIPHYHQSPSELEPQFTTVVSIATSVNQVGYIDIPAYNVAVQGDFIYIDAGREGLHIFDVSDPTKPVDVEVQSEQEAWYDAYVADGRNLKVSDIPDQVILEKFNSPDIRVSDFFLTEEYLYIISSNRENPEQDYLKILNRSSLVEIGSFTLTYPFNAEPMKIEISIINSLAYIRTEVPWLGVGTDPISNWIVLDVSDPTAPVEVTNVYTPKIIEDIVFVDNYAYLADGKAGLRILDISNPIAPVEVDAFGVGKPRYAFDVEVSDGYIYLANGEGGLSILQYTYP